MNMYVRKTPDPVEAFQFHGGAEEASQIINWLLGLGASVRHREARDAYEDVDWAVGYAAIPEHIWVCDDHQSFAVGIGHWVVYLGGCQFARFTNEEFVELYDPLESLDILRQKLSTQVNVHINGPQVPVVETTQLNEGGGRSCLDCC